MALEKTENKDICKTCGGKCCKACGCNYASFDFPEVNQKSIIHALESGHISIIARLDFQFAPNGKPFVSSTLYLRERNIGHEAIDLINISSTCISLTETGCTYDIENRPYGGAVLKPNYPGICNSHEAQDIVCNSWLPYQNILRKIVKKYTGKTVEEQIKTDVENLYYKLFTNDFNEFDSETSIFMYKDMIRDFLQVFPEEIIKAKKRAEGKENPVLRLTKN